MAVKEYFTTINKRTNVSRLGCSVCPLKNINDTLKVNSLSNQLMFKKKLTSYNKNHTNCDKSEITPTITRSKHNECYCNHMEHIKKKSYPKIVCSKRFKKPNLIDMDEDWLKEMMEFRRENWFDCHSDSFIDTTCIQHINHICKFIVLLISFISNLQPRYNNLDLIFLLIKLE